MENLREQIMEQASATPIKHGGSLIDANPAGSSISAARAAGGVGDSARVA